MKNDNKQWEEGVNIMLKIALKLLDEEKKNKNLIKYSQQESSGNVGR